MPEHLELLIFGLLLVVAVLVMLSRLFKVQDYWSRLSSVLETNSASLKRSKAIHG